MELKFPRFLVTVSKVRGKCYQGYKEGDKFIFEDFTKTPEGFCQGAATALFPCLYALTLLKKILVLFIPAVQMEEELSFLPKC